jgi:hypothetical protein
VDRTEGRFAEVVILACRACGDLWLRYSVEYEGFSGSGRWARGRIDAGTGAELSPKAALGHLEALPGYLYGGSYFDGAVGVRTGPMPWGLM